MITNILHEDDEFGLLPPEKKEIPYVSFKLTAEQVEKIKLKQPILYQVEGKKFFRIKDENGNWTDDYVMFLMFM